jgi:hypothetical protein
MKDIRYEKEYKIGDKEMNIIRYADDAVLNADNESNLQRLLHQFMLSCQKFHMKMTVSKTKALTVSKETVRCKLETQGNVVEQIMTFRYLGTEDTAAGSTTRSPQSRQHI